jgi:uncharacterized protein
MNRNRIYSVLATLGVMMMLVWPTSSEAESPRLFSMWQPHRSSPEELLRSAAYEGNLQDIRRLLAQGTEVDARDKEGWTPLIWAQAGDHPEAVKLLLENRASIDAKDNAGYTALHQAATGGRETVMAVLLAYGANAENVSNHGYTPLMDAAHYGKTVAVEFLLASGADPNAVGANGHTAISVADKRGHQNIAMLLAANGADPNLQGKKLRVAFAKMNSRTTGPARVRLAEHMRNPDVLESLCRECLAQQADPDIRFASGQRPDWNSRMAAWCRQKGIGEFRESRALDQTSGKWRHDETRSSGMRGGESHLLREALETWEQIQAKYPDAHNRLRDLSGRGISVDKIASKEPLVQKAMSLWLSLQSQHPDLAAQLLNIAGMAR